MSILDRALEPPSYGFERNGSLYVPTYRELFTEFFSRVNVFADRRNWLTATCWLFTWLLAVPFLYYLFNYFTWPLALLGLFYSLSFLGTHGTIWFHRYSTHRAYRFKNGFARFIISNLAIKIIPEELYVVSHHVHHLKSEKPGDPYNVYAGWWYCFLADAIHQPIARNLSEADYKTLTKLLDHTGVCINSYEQYLKWGSLCHPLTTYCHYILNWIFWYSLFYWLGGHELAMAIFGMSVIWAFGIRTFNYAGHGEGKDKRREGIDFDRENLSINQVWPGAITGEWHSNHHLYPNGARAGFLPYQFDPAWYFILAYKWLGGIESYRDYKEDFFRDHYRPYLERIRASAFPATDTLFTQADSAARSNSERTAQ